MRYEISWWQLMMIFVSVHLSILVSYAPFATGMLPPTRDAWLSSLLASVPAFLLAFIAYALVKRFQGENLYEFTRTILGRFFGTIVNVGVTVYFLHWTTVLLREFALFMDSVVYLRTPDTVFVIIFLILAIIGAGQQIEFIGRTAELASLLIMIGLIFLIVANVPQMDISRLRPFLAEGWRPVLQQSLTLMGIKAEAVWIVLLAVPYLNKISDAPKAIGIGLGINTLFAAVSSAVLIAIFGTELIAVLAFIPLTAARLIQFSEVLERLEWVMLLLWFGAMGVKVSLLLFGARLGISSLVPRWRPSTNLLLASALALGWSYVIFPTLTDMLTLFEPQHLLPQIAPLQLLPVLLIIVALLRGVKSNDGQTKENDR